MHYQLSNAPGYRLVPEHRLPAPWRVEFAKPEGYLPDLGLISACNVARCLGWPLLITGEPGTGKTLFADWVANELHLGDPENPGKALKFETKSDSVARDLFYTYDALARFRDIQSNLPDKQIQDYITYQALGKAILYTLEPAVAHSFAANLPSISKRRSVVLIDEVDKAARDFPNDILNELETMAFRVPELGNRVIKADETLAPLVIITSNAEKNLPDAFLRRCVYYHIAFPDGNRLREIVLKRLTTANLPEKFLTDAIEFFIELRDTSASLEKKPATAELLGWIVSLQNLTKDRANFWADTAALRQSISVLVKTESDQARALALINRLLTNQQPRRRPTR